MGESPLEHDIPAFDVAVLAEALFKCAREVRLFVGRGGLDVTNAVHLHGQLRFG
jgi:hypothetical protein